jgi:hypothetical protein
VQRHHAVVVIDCIVYDEAVGILLLHHWRCGPVHTEHTNTHTRSRGRPRRSKNESSTNHPAA